MAQHSRKRGRRSRLSTGAGAGGQGARGGRLEARNAAVRAALEPIAPGERPWPTAVSALIALCLVLANAVLLVAGVRPKIGSQRASTGGEVVYLGLMSICAHGLWRVRYWAVLGFMVILLLTILTAGLLLIRASNALGLGVAIVLIVGAGLLFYKLVRVLSRIQMPKTPEQ